MKELIPIVAMLFAGFIIAQGGEAIAQSCDQGKQDHKRPVPNDQPESAPEARSDRVDIPALFPD